MPELPELKIMCRQIANNAIGKKIVDLKIYKLKLRSVTQKELKSKIIGSSLKTMNCLGKTIVMKFSSSYYLQINLQSTGFFVYKSKKDSLSEKYTRAEFILSNGSRILFIDPRGYSYFKLMNHSQLKRELVHLGIDPLSKKFNYSIFLTFFRNRTTSIKNFLINKKIIFGIGTVYGDEICFEARVRPDRPVNTLKTSEIKRIFKAITKILKKSMEYDGLTLYLPVSNRTIRFDRFLKVYKRDGKSCRRCKGIVKKEKIGKTNSFYCPLCQS